VNFLFTLVGVQSFPRWLIKLLSMPILVKIGSRPIFDKFFEGLYGAARKLKSMFFRPPAPKDVVINVEV
jgi:hypothetical protein